jgi:hypothetical protein
MVADFFGLPLNVILSEFSAAGCGRSASQHKTMTQLRQDKGDWTTDQCGSGWHSKQAAHINAESLKK